jgi:DNA-binding Lrp family transcriptional regulator
LAIGFVLISVAPAREHYVYNELLKIPEIVELHPLFGEYDILVKVDAENFQRISEIIMRKIRTTPGVLATQTLSAIKF